MNKTLVVQPNRAELRTYIGRHISLIFLISFPPFLGLVTPPPKKNTLPAGGGLMRQVKQDSDIECICLYYEKAVPPLLRSVLVRCIRLVMNFVTCE